MYVFTRTKHITDHALGAYVRNELSDGFRDQVVEHLSDCGYCRTQLREVEQFITILGQSPSHRDFMLETALTAA
jgi:anti-sigma factor RsiW